MSNRDNGHKFAWSAVGTALVLVSALALMAPQAVAQATDSSGSDSDSKRYMGELDDTFRFVLQNYVDQPDAKKLYEGAMKGMFEALGDPYSVFLDENMLSDMTDITSGQFGGVGLYIGKQAKDPKKADDEPRYIEIESPIEDTPRRQVRAQVRRPHPQDKRREHRPLELLRGAAEDPRPPAARSC
jgi:C-terminal processing protease CtpA/Prc